MKTNNDFIKIEKWQFYDIYPKIVGDVPDRIEEVLDR